MVSVSIISMQPEVDQTIVNALKQYSSQGVTFFQAKQALLKQGYKDEDIELASGSYDYGSPQSQPDPLTQDFKKDPQDTEKVAQDLLKNDKQQREEQAVVNGIAGQHSVDLQSDLKYQNNFLSAIGMSWWTWIVIEIVVSAAIYFFKLPKYSYGITALILVVALAIKRA